MSNLANWIKSLVGDSSTDCECGADKANLGEYAHSTWCPSFKSPHNLNLMCECGTGGWHSATCHNRIWPEVKPPNQEKIIRDTMKKVIDSLNKQK